VKDRGAFDWFSVLTNLGVMAGLILVAYEVRQAEAATSHDFVTGVQINRQELALSADLAEIYVKANANGVETLTPVEKFRMTEWEQANKIRMIGQIIQYRSGFLSRGAMVAMLPVLTSREKGIWADLGIPPITAFDNEIGPIRDEMGLRD